MPVQAGQQDQQADDRQRQGAGTHPSTIASLPHSPTPPLRVGCGGFGSVPAPATPCCDPGQAANHAATNTTTFHQTQPQASKTGTAPAAPGVGVVALVASLLCAGAWPVAAAGVSASGSGSALALAWLHHPALTFVVVALVVWAGALCSKTQVRVVLHHVVLHSYWAGCCSAHGHGY